MKDILDYKDYFQTGLWHVHTTYTDGVHSVDEVCQYALKKNYPLVCFSEHIRKEPTYNPKEFLAEIETAKKKYSDVILLSGFEARILADGSIDCPQDMQEAADIIFLAEHSWKEDYNTYVQALKKGLENPHVQVWAHPGTIPARKGWHVKEEDVKLLKQTALNNSVIIEKSNKYGVLIPSLYDNLTKEQYTIGEDLHRIK